MRSKRRIVPAILVVTLTSALAAPALAQDLARAAPEEVGLSSERLERL